MRIALLVQCHCLPKQINMLLDVMNSDDIDIFIHVDKKSDIIKDLTHRENIFFVKDNDRIDVRWATISQVDATLVLLRYAMEQSASYDYFFLISGQDFLIKTVEEMLLFFKQNAGKNFVNLFESKSILGKPTNYDKRNEIVYPKWCLRKGLVYRVLRRIYVALTGGYYHTWRICKRKNILGLTFYFGSQWWCLSAAFVKYMMDYLTNHPQYYSFFKKSCCPDESFFQTLLMNSPFADTRCEYLHYIDWTGCSNSPNVLHMRDYTSVKNSSALMARKCDMRNDGGLVEKLYKEMKDK